MLAEGQRRRARGADVVGERAASGGRIVIITLPAAARLPSGAPTRANYPDEEMQPT
jgi:hypothetical protein